ncbi:MAG TPA: VWA domain-containing protein, partial [Acidimicrobiales bacterium]|nr:VWA domain-containing protein [Acidimicrobiales bacterium]
MTPRRRRGLLAGGLGLLTLLLAAAPAGAAPAASTLLVRRVDTTSMPKVTVDVEAGSHALTAGNVVLVENGQRLQPASVTSYSDAQVPTATVLVIDTASSMNEAKMFAARDAMKRIIAAKSTADQIAIVAYGDRARTVQDFTADQATLDAAVDRIAVAGSAKLYDGMQLGASLLSEQPSAMPQLVLIADGDDKGSKVVGSAALAEVLSSNALTYTIGLSQPRVDLSEPAQFAAQGGGAMFTASNEATEPDAARQVVQDLHGQYRITYHSAIVGSHAASLVITGPGVEGTAQVVPGGVAVGAAVNPAPVHLAQAPGLLRGKVGLLLVAVLVLAAAALLTYAAVLLITREGSALTMAMEPFREHKDDGEGGLLRTDFVRRAVETSERIASERGILDVIEAKLEQADLALRPGEAFVVYVVAALLATAFALFEGGIIWGIIALGVIAILPPAVLNFLAAQRIRKFTTQLPDTLQLLASSLRAGFSFLQGVEAVAQEVSDPMGAELRRVIVEARLGRPVEAALEDCAGRMKSPDFDWAVMAVNIQRE